MGIRTKLNPMGGKVGGGVIPSSSSSIVCSNDTTWYIDSLGDLYGCGRNEFGQQGAGYISESPPYGITTFTKRASNVKDVACSNTTTWYVDLDGDLYGCGYNNHGQQGNGSTSNVTTFTKRASNVKRVICSTNTTWYINSNGDLYGCGWNNSGQQSSGNATDVKTFTKRASNVADIVCSPSATWYIATNGDLYGCGYGQQGSQGDGGASNVKTFTKRASNVKQVIRADGTDSVTWYLTNDGDLYGCGGNSFGEQGSGNTTAVTSFTRRATGVDLFACTDRNTYYKKNGYVYSCGANSYGQLGLGYTSTSEKYFYAISNLSQFGNVYDIKCANYVVYFGENSSQQPCVLVGCGYNNHGQKGNGTTTNMDTCASLASDINFYDFACSDYTTWYINTSGELYGAGYNNYGQQGSGGTSDVTTFTKRADL